jgi:hypothetical protein
MSRQAAKGTRRNGAIRCAIYTRKSSEEGLEQEFNSLLAQREACEAFIKSQRHAFNSYFIYDAGQPREKLQVPPPALRGAAATPWDLRNQGPAGDGSHDPRPGGNPPLGPVA